MSKLTETKRAYDRLKRLLDEEARQRKGELKDLQRYQEALDVAFYLLGWAQFEYLVREESKETILEKASTKGVEKHAWEYLKASLKEFPVRKRLDLIFHSKPEIRAKLDADYTVRNEAAHNYKNLPAEARDVSQWLLKLEELVDKFEH
ncbi:hypothetical protein KTE26_11355 [Ralstonia mannitolilytica]|uniref:hypothetical protein n=1 Tax=Ralstonia mannitolilytica TaxID=105219 RepID=UPI000CEDCD23|nr:hypothetical protein [Ralstonia mannitolilytica]MBU9579031.1 hypothetical protein [Ralstonia mannitolilytica]